MRRTLIFACLLLASAWLATAAAQTPAAPPAPPAPPAEPTTTSALTQLQERAIKQNFERMQQMAGPTLQMAGPNAKAFTYFPDGANAGYQRGLNEIDAAQWQEALATFNRIAASGGQKADAALYWSAYADNKLGHRDDSLAAIQQLEQKFPQSQWKSDAEALAVQVHQANGQPVSPASQDNDDLKLLAINSLMQSEPAQALPLLEKVLRGPGSPALKDRALFVMAQSRSPESTQELIHIAQGGGNPDLQAKAAQYLGMLGGSEGRAALPAIYDATTDPAVKRQILSSYMQAGDRAHLLAAAQNEKSPELQQTAIEYLGSMGARDELGKLYQSNLPEAAKEEIIRAIAMRHGDDAAQALVDLARKETNPQLKRQIVQSLSQIHSKIATDYMLELLNQ